MVINAFSGAQPSPKATEKFGKDNDSEERQAVGEEGNRRVAHEDNFKRVSKPNPFAKGWDYSTEYRRAVDQRSLFFTFAGGYPIRKYHIKLYFTRIYGYCLEDVIIGRRAKLDGLAEFPLYGRLIFNTVFLPVMILGGRKEAKFTIMGRSLWCKPYCPPKIEIEN